MTALAHRYLLKFSYVGTGFSGVAKQHNAHTVFNVLQSSFDDHLNDRCKLASKIQISSRTDAGVHALANTAHLDLELNQEFRERAIGHTRGKTWFSEDAHHYICSEIKKSLNGLYLENDVPIRIVGMQKVNPIFHARVYAKSRTYIYRLAYLHDGGKLWSEYESAMKVQKSLTDPTSKLLHNNQPPFVLRTFGNVFDRNFLTEISEPFDIELFREAIIKLNRKSDFSAFTTKQGRDEVAKYLLNPVKSVQVDINTVNPTFTHQALTQANELKYQVIELRIRAESFLYKMIRKMVGAAVDVSHKRYPPSLIDDMFERPHEFYDLNHSTILKPNGLFLKEVNYDPEDFDMPIPKPKKQFHQELEHEPAVHVNKKSS